MRIHRTGGRLRRRASRREDVNPMNYMSNLVDAMLVLAVGIMLALVVSWNLQISSTGQIDIEKQAVTKEDASSSFDENDMVPADEEEVENNENLQEEGKVYYDTKTGKYYIIKDE